MRNDRATNIHFTGKSLLKKGNAVKHLHLFSYDTTVSNNINSYMYIQRIIDKNKQCAM